MGTRWQQVSSIQPRTYSCGFCNAVVGGTYGYWSASDRSILICPNCDQPAYFNERSEQIPGALEGAKVAHVPAPLDDLFQEARRCYASAAYTAAVLICRKMLMNIAVHEGASEGLKFIEYVQHLSDKGYIPPNGKHWVDHIRKKGNEATHEIAVMSQGDASELLQFTEALLKFVYEFPNRVPKP